MGKHLENAEKITFVNPKEIDVIKMKMNNYLLIYELPDYQSLFATGSLKVPPPLRPKKRPPVSLERGSSQSGRF